MVTCSNPFSLRWTVPAVALLAVLGLMALAPTGGASQVEEGHFRFVGTQYEDQTFSTTSFHPSNGTVLVGGGNGSYEDETAERTLITYDGRNWDLVLRQRSDKGKIIDVEWAPQGDIALVLSEGSPNEGSIVVCHAPCTKASDHMTEIWRYGYSNYTQGANPYAKDGRGFPGRQVEWHPSGEAALITGGGLLQWNRTHMNLVDAGGETIYNAGDWHPSGDWALLQKDLNKFAVCDEPCRDGTQLRSVSEASDLYFCKWHCGNPTATKSIDNIRFGPDGERAYVVGLNYCDNCSGGPGGRGLVMEISGIDPAGGTPDPANWTTRYLVPEGDGGPSFGEVTDLAWHPEDREMLVTKSLEHQITRLTETDGQVAGPFETLLDLRAAGKMFAVEWSPDGVYAVVPTADGFIRYDDPGHPTVNVTEPNASEVETRDPVTVRGEARPKPDGAPVQAVEVRPGEVVWTGSRYAVEWTDDWTLIDEENLTRRSDGVVEWSYRWNASGRPSGDYTLAFRANDTDLWGPSSSLEIDVPPGPGEDGLQPPPNFRVTDVNKTTEVVTVAWDPVEGASSYFLEVASNRSFEDGELVAEVDGSQTSYERRQQPQEQWYRVQGFVDGDKTPWTDPLLVDRTEEPPEDDGSTGGTSGSEGDRTRWSDDTSSFPGGEGAGDPEADHRGGDGSDGGHDEIGDGEASDGDGTDDGELPSREDGETGSSGDALGGNLLPGPALPAVLAVLLAAARRRGRR